MGCLPYFDIVRCTTDLFPCFQITGWRRIVGTKFGGSGTCSVGVCGHFFSLVYCFFPFASTELFVIGVFRSGLSVEQNHEHDDCRIQEESCHYL